MFSHAAILNCKKCFKQKVLTQEASVLSGQATQRRKGLTQVKVCDGIYGMCMQETGNNDEICDHTDPDSKGSR